MNDFMYVINLPGTALYLTGMAEGVIMFEPDSTRAMAWKSRDEASVIAKEFGCTVSAVPCEG